LTGMRNIFLLITAYIFASCIDRFEVAVPRQEGILVVEALLLDSAQYQYVKLSSSDTTGAAQPINHATVTLHGADEMEWSFYLSNEGEYRPFPAPINLRPGDIFQIEILVGDSIRALSSWETVPARVAAGPTILEPKFKTVVNDLGFESTLKGVEIIASTASMPTDEVYLRWDYEVTYGYDAPWASDLCAECHYCFIVEGSKGLNETSEVLKSESKVLGGRSLDFVLISEKFAIRYAVLVKQISITRSAYQYYRSIYQLNTASGSIFDPPPAVIVGNLKNVLNEDNPVYGFFEVGTYSESSATVTAPDIPFLIPSSLERCLDLASDNSPDVADCYVCGSRQGATQNRPHYY